MTQDSLYESADLNLFINNGPCVVASLSKDVKFLMFKVLTEELSTEAPFLRDLGYAINENPKYLNKNQKYIWKNDTYENIIDEVYDFLNLTYKLQIIVIPINFILSPIHKFFEYIVC